jgi:hypothetical protein
MLGAMEAFRGLTQNDNTQDKAVMYGEDVDKPVISPTASGFTITAFFSSLLNGSG